ncbi:MAG: efflux RND transporter periplasmic adaptor subunit [Roseimicrobium sp.]
MFSQFHHPIALAGCVVCLALAACSKSPEGAQGGGGRGGSAAPVTVSEVLKKDMPVVLPGIGNVRPFSTVSVKPRVSGQIAQIHYKEGQFVKEGDLLVTLDPKPFEVALAQAKAKQNQVLTQLNLAQTQADRYATLQKSGAVAKEQLDQIQSDLKVAQANAEAEKASVQAAELQLSYCTIKSPMAGRVGRRVVDAGNVIKADETELVVINQLQPIEVVFSVPEQFLGVISKEMAKGPLKAGITPNENVSLQATGELTFVDNTVKAATGTIELKAAFPNKDLTLWPGQFGEVTLTLSMQKDATVAPAMAIQTGQQGPYAFVVKPDKTVEVRPVVVERTVGDESVIEKGLTPGESVVVDGHMRLFPGAKVELKPPVGSEPPAAATTGKQVANTLP